MCSGRRRSGARAYGRAPRDHGPAVALAQHAQLRQLRLVQRIVALGEVQHRVVEPFLLVLGGGFQHAAAQNVREQLVASLFEGGGGGHLAGFRTLLGHAWGAPLWSEPGTRGLGDGSGRAGRRSIGAAMYKGALGDEKAGTGRGGWY